MNRRTLLAGALAVVSTALAQPGTPRPAPHPLPDHKGSVLVLLLGMPGCPGTETATVFLAGYKSAIPGGVSILRLDVPPPDGKLEPATNNIGIPRAFDTGRVIATKLEFFFYPTLYLLDRDGVVRFAGSCEPAKVKEMVAEVAAEEPGAPKKMYTPPLLALGAPMPEWSGTNLAGKAVTLASLRGEKATVLFFGAVSCPFSNKALESLPKLAKDYAGKGVSVTIVTRSAADAATRSLHAKAAPGIPVVADPMDAIGKAVCHVPAVPFFFVLDGTGKATARQPFTDAAARAALDAAGGTPAGGCATSTGAG